MLLSLRSLFPRSCCLMLSNSITLGAAHTPAIPKQAAEGTPGKAGQEGAWTNIGLQGVSLASQAALPHRDPRIYLNSCLHHKCCAAILRQHPALLPKEQPPPAQASTQHPIPRRQRHLPLTSALASDGNPSLARDLMGLSSATEPPQATGERHYRGPGSKGTETCH